VRYEPTFSGMFWIYRDDLLRHMRPILVSFRRIKRCRRNAGVVRGLHFQPAGGAGKNWRVDRSSTSRSISAADRRITARLDPRARTTKSTARNLQQIASRRAGGPCARRSPRYDPAHRRAVRLRRTPARTIEGCGHRQEKSVLAVVSKVLTRCIRFSIGAP
jgi:hypothetical protein